MTQETQTRKRYTDDFKREAVALITEQDYSISEAARQLGVHHTSLRKWVKQFTQGSPTEILNQSERDELLKLRKENRELRMEKEILKKASAFFAKELSIKPLSPPLKKGDALPQSYIKRRNFNKRLC